MGLLCNGEILGALIELARLECGEVEGECIIGCFSRKNLFECFSSFEILDTLHDNE